MARVEAYDSINLIDPSVWYGDALETGFGRYVVSDGYRTGVFEGRSFSYNAYGELTGGAVESYAEYAGGALVHELSGLNHSGRDVGDFLYYDDLPGLYAWVLAGPDDIYGSSGDDDLAGYAGNDVIYTGGGDDYVLAGSGNDVVFVEPGFVYVDGGTGVDWVELPGWGNDYTYDAAGNEWYFDGNGVALTATNVERIGFDNGVLALDLDGVAGQAYRMYQAAFARDPDPAGLSWWIEAMDAGMSLYQAAVGFVHSAEFRDTYGPNPSNTVLVGELYYNILGRPGDDFEIDYWARELDTGARDRAEVLAGFSESRENIMGVAPEIEHGIWYV